ncbi:MAG: WD40 repeat domain-containing protein, partial [Planctomycetota bacterium]|nr:WD40 repeat domain-containing protein [Planctomycetota bacterium]
MPFPVAKTDPKACHLSKTLTYAKPLVSCRFDPTGRYLFGASQDFSVVRWTLADDSMKVFKAHDSWVRGLEFSKDGKTIISSGYDDR